MCGHFWRSKCFVVAAAATLFCAASDVLPSAQHVQCFTLEFFYDSGVNDAAELQAALKEFAANRTGITLHFRDVHESEEARKRIDTIAKYFRLPEVKLPAIYGLNNLLSELTTKEQLQSRLNQILTLTAYVRNGGLSPLRGGKGIFQRSWFPLPGTQDRLPRGRHRPKRPE